MINIITKVHNNWLLENITRNLKIIKLEVVHILTLSVTTRKINLRLIHKDIPQSPVF